MILDYLAIRRKSVTKGSMGRDPPSATSFNDFGLFGYQRKEVLHIREQGFHGVQNYKKVNFQDEITRPWQLGSHYIIIFCNSLV